MTHGTAFALHYHRALRLALALGAACVVAAVFVPLGAAQDGPRPGSPARGNSPDATTDNAPANRAPPALPPVARRGWGFELRTAGPAALVNEWQARLTAIVASLRRVFPPHARRRDAAGRPKALGYVVFPGRPAYRAYAARHSPENAEAQAYYDPTARRIVTYDSGEAAVLTRTLLHETVHAAFRDYLGHDYAPPWIDEGLACYYETGRVQGGRVRFGGRHTVLGPIVRNKAVLEQLPEFEAFATLGSAKFLAKGDTTKLRTHYALAWGWAYVLIEAKGGALVTHLKAYFHAVRATPDPTARYKKAYRTALAPHAKQLESAFTAAILALPK